MRISMKDIPASGREVAFSLDVPWAVEAATEALEGAPSALGGVLCFARDGSTIIVLGNAAAAVDRICDRCGNSVTMSLAADERMVYKPARTDGDAGDFELAEADLDVGWYEDGRLELADVLSEFLALAMPARITCIDEASCLVAPSLEQATEEPSGHPAFAALKNLF